MRSDPGFAIGSSDDCIRALVHHDAVDGCSGLPGAFELAAVQRAEEAREFALMRRENGTMRQRLQAFRTPLGQQYQCVRSEEHTSELPSLMRISYAVFCWKTQTRTMTSTPHPCCAFTPPQSGTTTYTYS